MSHTATPPTLEPKLSPAAGKASRATQYFLVFGSLLVFGLLDNSRGPLYPKILDDLKISTSLGSWFFAASSIGAALSGLFTNRLLPIIGSLIGIKIGVFFLGLAYLGISFSENLFQLVASAFLLGWATGLLSVAQNVALVQLTEPERLPRIQSLFHSMYAFSSLSAPLIIAGMISTQFGWRDSARWIAFVPLVVVTLSLNIRSHKNQEERQAPSRFRDLPRPAIGMAVGLALFVATEVILSSRLVLFLTWQHQFTFNAASIFLSLFFIGLALGRVLGGTRWALNWRNNRGAQSQIDWICGVTAVVILLGIGLIPEILFLAGLSIALLFPITMAHIVECYRQYTVALSSMAFTLISVVLVTAHTTFGKTADLLDLNWAMGLSFICLAAAWALFRASNPKRI